MKYVELFKHLQIQLFCWVTFGISFSRQNYVFYLLGSLICFKTAVVHFCRVLVKSSRKLAQQYKLTYQEEIPTAQLVQRIANVMQEYTQQG